MTNKEQAIDYANRVLNAWKVNPYNRTFYAGKEGAERFAREFGYGLNDFELTEKDLKDVIQSTYSILCVRAYDLKPPIDAKQWVKQINSQIKK